MEAIDLIRKVALAWAPPPPLTCSQWADKFRKVADGPYPGQWSTARTPYLKEPMDCVTDPEIERIVVIKPTRIGGTEGIINNAIGYHIHYDPCKIICIQTTDLTARVFSTSILSPMIDATPELRALVSRKRMKKSKQTQSEKTFPGGDIRMFGTKATNKLRQILARVVIVDDLDGLDGTEQKKEGDIVKLAEGRTKGIWNKKIILISSPTVEGVSRIEDAFKLSDRRYRHVPCPRCGEYQVLKFGGKDFDFGLKWNENGDIWYVCEHCRGKILEHEKGDMDRLGEYRAEAQFDGTAGFHLNPFLCTFHPWADFRKEFLESKSNPYKLMVFVNQYLGEVWKGTKERIEEDTLYNRREEYPAAVPAGALILTAGVDVQDKWVEIVVMGWGFGEESWHVEHKIIQGSFIEDKVQGMLDDYLLSRFRHESGHLMGISRVCIDSGGHLTTQVYRYCKDREHRGVYAVHGSKNQKADVLDGQITRRKDAVFQMVGVTTCKDALYGRLEIKAPGPGYMHFPMSYDREFFRQLLSEKAVVYKDVRRYVVTPGRRNEAVDLHSYNLAALRLYNPDWEQLRRYGAEEDSTRKVFKPHDPAKHADPSIVLNPNLKIIICCDFGKNPNIWPLAQTDGKRVWVFDEVAIRNATTAEMAVEVNRKYTGHKAGFSVYGSAIGSVRSSTGKTEYAILRDYGFNYHNIRHTNPTFTDRINDVNNMLENLAGEARLQYNPTTCIYLKNDFARGLWKEDRSDMDRTDFGRGNAVEALSYFIEYNWPIRAARKTEQRFWK